MLRVGRWGDIVATVDLLKLKHFDFQTKWRTMMVHVGSVCNAVAMAMHIVRGKDSSDF